MALFTCVRCGQMKPVQTEGGTGYSENDTGQKTCYACCADVDKEWMIDKGKITLYLVKKEGQHRVSNWPGTLSFHVDRMETSRHNIAGKRYDVWFYGPEGARWHGVQYGDNTQLCHCKRTKK